MKTRKVIRYKVAGLWTNGKGRYWFGAADDGFTATFDSPENCLKYTAKAGIVISSEEIKPYQTEEIPVSL